MAGTVDREDLKLSNLCVSGVRSQNLETIFCETPQHSIEIRVTSCA